MAEPIQIGGTIPAQNVKENDHLSSSPLVLKGKNIIVGVPGAFTGTCHAHVPGYVKHYDDFKAKGFNEIYIFAVNDAFVTRAWKEIVAPDGSPVHFIADDRAAFAKSIGLSFDATPLLGGTRSKRYVITTEDDKVTSLTIEPDSGKLSITAAKEILAKL